MDNPEQQPTTATPPAKRVVPRQPGEVITSMATGNSYTMGDRIGEGHFGVVYSCQDDWNNDLAAKVLKPIGSYEQVKALAENELSKLLQLRNPYITYVYDAFEFRDTSTLSPRGATAPLQNSFKTTNSTVKTGSCRLHGVSCKQYIICM